MIEIRGAAAFSTSLERLKDPRAKAKSASRLRRLALGNAGEVQPVGGGISELRVHYGPDDQVYFTQRGDTLVILLCGGDKGTQRRDIVTARTLAGKLEQ